MRTKPFILKPADRKPALNAIGVQITVLAPEGAIQDQQVTIQAGPEGIGPPPHSHDWDETFYVTRGQVDFLCGGETAACSAGTLVHVPAGTVHAFCFGPGGGEMFEITGKRSNAIAMFTALDREILPGPPDLTKAIEVLAENGVSVHT
jgi:quercetin dioxygenase-like cupin family protein